MAKQIDTQKLRSETRALEINRETYGLLCQPDYKYGPWGPGKSNGDPTVPPRFAGLFPEAVIGSDIAESILNTVLQRHLEAIVNEAQEIARRRLDITTDNIRNLVGVNPDA